MLIDGYFCIDKDCPKRWCWSPGRFEHRATVLKGSINTNQFTLTCMHNAYHGCPDPVPELGLSSEKYFERIVKEEDK